MCGMEDEPHYCGVVANIKAISILMYKFFFYFFFHYKLHDCVSLTESYRIARICAEYPVFICNETKTIHGDDQNYKKKRRKN